MSIFDEKNKVKSNYVAFKTIGDKVEGTLVGKRTVANVLRPGTDQVVYELKKLDGSYTDVYGKPGIDMQMKHIKLGQIVGFEFTKIIPATRPGYKPTNVIQVYADEKTVDEKWLMEQESTETETDAAPAVEQTVGVALTTDELLKEINNLAVTKLGAKDAESVKQLVMEKTGLAFIEVNLKIILETLQQLP